MNSCKACENQKPASHSGPPENFRPGLGRWVTRKEYIKRLAICSECPDLQTADTCGHCACLIKYRAALKDKSCPSPIKNHWQ